MEVIKKENNSDIFTTTSIEINVNININIKC